MVAKPEVKSVNWYQVALICLILLNISAVYWFFTYGPTAFNSYVWIHDRQQRHRMCDNLYFLTGKSEDEVLNMLGKPDRVLGNGWTYYMGNNRSPDWWTFYVEFDKNKTVNILSEDRID